MEGNEAVAIKASIEDATSCCRFIYNNPDASWNEEFGYQTWLCEHPELVGGRRQPGQKYVVIPD